jgi:hypothetical protein
MHGFYLAVLAPKSCNRTQNYQRVDEQPTIHGGREGKRFQMTDLLRSADVA